MAKKMAITTIKMTCTTCNKVVTYTAKDGDALQKRAEKAGKPMEQFMKEFVCRACTPKAEKPAPKKAKARAKKASKKVTKKAKLANVSRGTNGRFQKKG
jgi:rubredoxin